MRDEGRRGWTSSPETFIPHSSFLILHPSSFLEVLASEQLSQSTQPNHLRNIEKAYISLGHIGCSSFQMTTCHFRVLPGSIVRKADCLLIPVLLLLVSLEVYGQKPSRPQHGQGKHPLRLTLSSNARVLDSKGFVLNKLIRLRLLLLALNFALPALCER